MSTRWGFAAVVAVIFVVSVILMWYVLASY